MPLTPTELQIPTASQSTKNLPAFLKKPVAISSGDRAANQVLESAVALRFK